MSAIIRDAFRVKTLSAFIAALSTQSLYLGIGRPEYWDTVGNTDTIVPIPVNTIAGVDADWSDMMQMKRINATDASNGIYKEMWSPNTIYDVYRHDWDGSRISVYNGASTTPSLPSSLGDVKCFIVTSTYNIYVCLKQAFVNGVVQPSLYSPDTGISIGTNTTIIKTADNYYWKFIATTSAANIIKFSSSYYHPVTTIQSSVTSIDPYYNQWMAQQYSANFAGGIYVINVLSGGSGYNGGVAGIRVVTASNTDTQFAIVGDGNGLQYTVVYGAGGTILTIEVESPGNNYTQATIVANGGIGGIFEVIFTPLSGLGVSPIDDVIARYMLISTSLVDAEGGIFTTSNDYRKLTLVYNPYSFGTTVPATSADLDATISLNMGLGIASGAYPSDAIITGQSSLAKGRVVDFTPSTGILRLIRTPSENTNSVGASRPFIVSELVTSSPGTGTSSIQNIIQPQVQPFSGSILYSEYRNAVMRGATQTEVLQIIVKY